MFRGKGKAGELRRYWEVKGGGVGFKGVAKGTKTIDLEWPLTPLSFFILTGWWRKAKVGG